VFVLTTSKICLVFKVKFTSNPPFPVCQIVLILGSIKPPVHGRADHIASVVVSVGCSCDRVTLKIFSQYVTPYVNGEDMNMFIPLPLTWLRDVPLFCINYPHVSIMVTKRTSAVYNVNFSWSGPNAIVVVLWQHPDSCKIQSGFVVVDRLTKVSINRIFYLIISIDVRCSTLNHFVL